MVQEDESILVRVLQYYGGTDHVSDSDNNQKIRCVVHSDSVASASVNPVKSVYHCFGCGFGGDALSIIMEKEGVDFIGAKQFAEDVFGYSNETVPERSTPEPGASRLFNRKSRSKRGQSGRIRFRSSG